MLAYAGLKRLGLEKEITEVLSPAVSLPAVGQGVLAIQCRTDDAEVRGLLAPLEDAMTRIAVTAERALLAKLEGGCTVPLAGHATVADGEVHLRGFVGRPDGSKMVRGRGARPGGAGTRAGGEARGRAALARGRRDPPRLRAHRVHAELLTGGGDARGHLP